MDVRKRKIWDMYGPQTVLEVRPSDCYHFLNEYLICDDAVKHI